MRNLVVLLFFFIHLNSFAGGWIQKADFGGIARHRTTMLTLGNKIYIGLGHYNGAGPNVLFNDWWEYDPATNSWAQKSDYLGGICYHATGFAMNNIGYVGTGRVSENGSTLVQDFFKYDSSTNSWVQITNFPGIARRGAVSFVIGEYAYTGSGESNTGMLGSFYRFDPSNETWLQVASLPVDRTSAVGFSIGNYGYVGTGDLGSNTSTNDFWQYDPNSNLWMQKASVGPQNRLEAMGFALNGRGYLGTGGAVSNGTSFGDMWEYIPETDTWVQIEDFLGTARRYFSATTLNGFAYAALGTNGTNFKDFWLFDQSLSLVERSLENVTILAYPNPVHDFVQFYVDWNEGIELNRIQLKINSIDGREVYSSPWQKGLKIDARSWKSGNCIYSIIYDAKIVKSDQLIPY